MKLAIAADHAGFPLKEMLVEVLRAQGHEMLDLGTDSADRAVDYPDFAEAVARAVVSGEAERGIVVCGSGVGASIAANKVPGVYAALCHDTYSAERARKSNNAQVLTMGGRVIGPELAKTIVETWLQAEYEEGTPSAPKVQRMIEIDRKYQAQR